MARKYKQLSAAELDVLWSRWGQGETAVQISAVMGCHKCTVTWYVSRAGGVRPRERRRAARHLTLDEREEISRGLAQGDGVCAVARRLRRPVSTISREIQRHGGVAACRASRADAAAWANGRRPKRAKRAGDQRLRRRVERKLADDWSPQQIAAWLRQRYPDDLTMHVSHETIYQAVYVQARGALKRELAAHLRRGRRYRRPRAAARVDRGPGQLVDIVPIAERPPSADTRAVPGHWEGTCWWVSAGRRSRRSSNGSRALCSSCASPPPTRRRWWRRWRGAFTSSRRRYGSR